jgi:type I restriction enzyme S subunit
LGAIAEDFSDSDLPWKVDVVDWATTAESFRKIIERDKVVVQEARRGGGMAGKWKNITLGDFVALQRGHDLTEPERRPGRVPVMGSAGQNGFHDTALAKGPGIVIGRSGASFGQVHFCTTDYWPHNTGLYVTDFKENDPLFAYYFLKALDFDRYNSGSAQPSLNRNFIYPIPICVPEPDEQKSIAHILGTLDDKIELNRRMNETLEAIARALFKSWFVDFDPVRAKMSGEPPESICQRLGLPPDLLALFPDRLVDSELGEIPEGWAASTLGSHIEIFDSKRVPLSNREREKRKGTYPYYGATSVMDHVDDYIFDGIYVLVGEDGSVVKENGEPFLQYVWGKFWVNNHAHVLQAKKPVSNEHLLLMLKQTNVASFVTGAVQLKISQGNLKRIPFVNAPDPINENFAKIVASLFDTIRAREDEIQTLTEVRDSLLPKLLSGELRVPQTEKTLEVLS